MTTCRIDRDAASCYTRTQPTETTMTTYRATRVTHSAEGVPVHAEPRDVRHGLTLAEVAALTKLDPDEIEWAIEEEGQCDSEEWTIEEEEPHHA